MPAFRNLKEFLLQKEKETEFDVATGDFDALEIRQGKQGDFFYFFDTKRNRLVKTFVLREGQKVDTMCDVVLIKKDEGYTPRPTFWKKDRTKGKVVDLSEPGLVAEDRTVLIKSRVDLRDCYQNFWKLIRFLETFTGVVLPAHEFRVASGETAELVRAMAGRDKAEVLSAVRTYLSGDINEADVAMLLDRRAALQHFERLLNDEAFFGSERARLGETAEGVWQRFFEENTWIFGYGLTLVACEKYEDAGLEQMTTGRNLFTGGGKRSDAVMRTRGFLQTLLFAEIKRHDTPLLMGSAYRPPDVYQPSDDMSGAVSQVQKTAHKAVKKLEDLHRQSDPQGVYQFEVSTVRPRQVVVGGMLDQLAEGGEVNTERMSSFELWRRGQLGVDVLTYDEVFERACFIVESEQPD
jgi:hypothetical protein